MNNDTLWAQSIMSGGQITEIIKVGVFDQNDQLITTDSSSLCILSSYDLSLQISGVTKVVAQNGIYSYSSINVIAQPNYTTSIEFTSTAIDANLFKSSNQTAFGPSISAEIFFRSCIIGEVTQNKKCILCTRGTYSLDPTQSICAACINQATCSGGSNITVNPGYWRSALNSTIVYTCLSGDACIGGSNSTCSDGYEGIFCSRCEGITSNGIYGSVGGGKCALCASLSKQLVLYFALLGLRGLYIIYVLYNLFQNPIRNNPQTVLVRILMSYIQVVSLVTDFDLQWPDAVKTFLEGFSSIINSQNSFYSLDCIFYQVASTSSYYSQVIVMGLTPIFVSAISGFIWYIILKFRKERNQNQQIVNQVSGSNKGGRYELLNKLVATTFIIILLWQPIVISYSFQLFMCVDYEDGNQYLKNDTSIQCWSGNHYLMSLSIGLAFIILYIVLFPLYIIIKLKAQSKNLDKTQNLQVYGIFYIGLNDGAYFWEVIVVTLRKVLLVICATVMTQSETMIKGYIGILTLILHRYSMHYMTPYIDPHFNNIDNYGTMAAIFTILGGVLITKDTSTTPNQNYNQNDGWIVTFVLLVIFACNIMFLLMWLKNFLSITFRKHFQKIQRFLCCRYFKQLEVLNYEDNLYHRRLTMKIDRLSTQDSKKNQGDSNQGIQHDSPFKFNNFKQQQRSRSQQSRSNISSSRVMLSNGDKDLPSAIDRYDNQDLHHPPDLSIQGRRRNNNTNETEMIVKRRSTKRRLEREEQSHAR